MFVNNLDFIEGLIGGTREGFVSPKNKTKHFPITEIISLLEIIFHKCGSSLALQLSQCLSIPRDLNFSSFLPSPYFQQWKEPTNYHRQNPCLAPYAASVPLLSPQHHSETKQQGKIGNALLQPQTVIKCSPQEEFWPTGFFLRLFWLRHSSFQMSSKFTSAHFYFFSTLEVKIFILLPLFFLWHVISIL